jgi:signal transduction histidine kinase
MGLFSDRRAWAADWTLSAGLLIWASTDVRWWWRPAGHSSATPVVLGGLALALAQSLPFVGRRRFPLAVAALAGACLGVKYGLGENLYSANAAVLVAAYGLGAYGGRRLRTVTRVLTGAAFATAIVVLLTSGGIRARALPFALLAAALGMGEVTSAHRAVAAASAQHAHDEERTLFARELHDVIAHQLSAIAVQAGAARVAAARDPAIAAGVVASIEQTARQGLVELNRLVGVLRHDPSEELGRAPQPGLGEGDLAALMSGARDAGVPVELMVEGRPRLLPASVELAGYRIVQESLTNALRYAGGAPTRICVTYADGGLEVRVVDDGPPARSHRDGAAGRDVGRDVGRGGGAGGAGGGRGLAGLEERAQMLGGRFHAGPRPAGGFEVQAWLPTDGVPEERLQRPTRTSKASSCRPGQR